MSSHIIDAMTSLKFLATSLLISFFGQNALAQPATDRYPGRDAELQAEKDAYAACLDHAFEPGESDACSQWIAIGTCAMTYRDRIGTLAHQLAPDRVQQYRIDARKKLPPYCDPMAAVGLDLEILELDHDFDESARRARWLDIIALSDKLVPAQRQHVARELAKSPEFAAILGTPQGRRFVEQARDETVTLLPDIAPETTQFLEELALLSDASWLTPTARAILLLDDLAHHRYASARSHWDRLDVSALDASVRTPIVQKIGAIATAIFGHPSFAELACFDTYPLPDLDHAAQARLEALTQTDAEAAVTLLRMEAAQWIPRCAPQRVVQHFARIFSRNAHAADVLAFADEWFDLLTRTHSQTWISATARAFATLERTPRDAFVHQYGARLARLAILTSHPDASDALKDVYDLIQTSSDTSTSAIQAELLMAMGNAQAAQHHTTQARQYWSVILEHKNWPAQTRAMAFYASIRSLRADNLHKQADALMTQFEDEMPASSWIALLRQ